MPLARAAPYKFLDQWVDLPLPQKVAGAIQVKTVEGVVLIHEVIRVEELGPQIDERYGVSIRKLAYAAIDFFAPLVELRRSRGEKALGINARARRGPS